MWSRGGSKVSGCSRPQMMGSSTMWRRGSAWSASVAPASRTETCPRNWKSRSKIPLGFPPKLAHAKKRIWTLMGFFVLVRPIEITQHCFTSATNRCFQPFHTYFHTSLLRYAVLRFAPQRSDSLPWAVLQHCCTGFFRRAIVAERSAFPRNAPLCRCFTIPRPWA